MPHTVLNVDDSAANRYLKSRALREAGFNVVEAATGSDALALALQRRPDLVLLDIKLPDMSGLDVCRLLKKDPKTEAIPVVHISATYVDEQMKSVSGDAGAEVYLAEPVGPNELTSTLKTVLRLRAAERAVAENHERMRLATEGAGIATWDLVVGSGQAVWSRQFCLMLGCDPATTRPSIESWLACVRPDERDRVAGTLIEAMERKGSVSLEHWVQPENGAERCIAAFGTMEADEEDNLRRLIGVAMDITDRKRVEAQRERLLEQARAAQQAAEEAARMKDEFLAILSHELRTPMSAVLGWLHLARTGALDPEQHEKALAIVERNARLQSQVINDLLDVSRIVTGKLERDPGTARLDEILRGAVETARLAAAARGIGLDTDIAPGRGSVQGSPARLEQIFSNLLSNAVKFSAEGGRIDVGLGASDGHVEVSVRDRGEGISRDLLPRIFDSFRQGDSSNRRRHGGLGLGLAIVKSLVELHGGRVAVESEGLGKGATFRVTLPILPDEDAPQDGAAFESDDASLKGLRVLVVDDEADHLELTTNMLRLCGAEVAAASGAAQALAAARELSPDALVLDIAMPGTDGYELLELLRRDLGMSPPAIALTGLASHADAVRAKAAGFQGHMAKPFEMQALRRLVTKLVRQPGNGAGEGR